MKPTRLGKYNKGRDVGNYTWWYDELDDTISLTDGTITVSKPRTYDTASDISDLFAMLKETEGNQV